MNNPTTEQTLMDPTQDKPEPLIDEQELARLSPEKLITGFTRTPVVHFAVIAVLLHVVVIVGSSLPFIYDTWINPEAAAARQAQVEAQRQAERDQELKDAAASSNDEAPSADGQTEQAGNGTATKQAPDKSRLEQELEEAAEPDEMPSLDELMTDNP